MVSRLTDGACRAALAPTNKFCPLDSTRGGVGIVSLDADAVLVAVLALDEIACSRRPSNSQYLPGRRPIFVILVVVMTQVNTLSIRYTHTQVRNASGKWSEIEDYSS